MVLKSKKLSYRYPNNSKTLTFPDFDLAAGENYLILGKSGSGKTTFLHLLALLLPIQKGELQILDVDISKMNGKELLNFRAKNISIIHQKPHFVKSLSALDNLKLAPYFAKENFNYELLKRFALKLQIDELLHKKPEELSGGEQQRLSILRAILNEPKLIFADEPTSNLDDDNCTRVFESLLEIANETNATLVIVTHDNRLKPLVKNQLKLL